MSKKVVMISLFTIMSNNALAHNEADLKPLICETQKEFDNIQYNHEKTKENPNILGKINKKVIKEIKARLKKENKIKKQELRNRRKMLSCIISANISEEDKQLLKNLVGESGNL